MSNEDDKRRKTTDHDLDFSDLIDEVEAGPSEPPAPPPKPPGPPPLPQPGRRTPPQINPFAPTVRMPTPIPREDPQSVSSRQMTPKQTVQMPAQQSAKLAEATRKPRVVLVVDDDEAIRDSLKMVLTEDVDEPFEVITAFNALDALNKLDEMKPALPGVVLLDIMMPEYPGWAFMAFIEKCERLWQLPVLIISAQTYPDRGAMSDERWVYLEKYRNAGNKIVAKPFDMPTLISTIEKKLDQSKKRGPLG